MAGHDPGRTHRAPATAPAGGVDRTWQTRVEGRYTVPAPAVVDGTVYLGSGHAVYAMALDGGETRWRASASAFTHHFSPAVAAGRVFVLARGRRGVRDGTGPPGRLLALDAGSGALEWATRLRGTTAPVVADGTLYLAASGERGRLRALGLDGRERWRVEGTDAALWDGLYAAPAVAGDRVHVAANAAGGGVVAALDAATGNPAWSTRVDGGFRVGPAAAGDRIYAATEGGTVHAFSRAGERRWRTALGAPVRTPLAVGDGAVYALADGTTVALDAETGRPRWRTDTGVTRMNGLALGAERLYVGGNRLTAIGRESGETVLDLPVNEGVGGAFGAPVVLEGGLLTGACTKEGPTEWYDNYLYALAPTAESGGDGDGGAGGDTGTLA
jgi:outer membrane protein assembly factor BamB